MMEFLAQNHVTRQPCWWSIQENIFSKNLPDNGGYFPELRNAFVLPHQHSRRDVTCKPAIGYLFLPSTFASALLCATEIPIGRAYQGVLSLQTIV